MDNLTDDRAYATEGYAAQWRDFPLQSIGGDKFNSNTNPASKLSAAILAAAIGAFGTQAIAANLVANGSFEAPSTTTHLYYTAGQSFSGWTVATGDIDIISTTWQASDGVQSLSLSGFVAGSIYQDIVISTGQTYLLQFDMSGDPEHSIYPMVKHMVVQLDGVELGTFTFDISSTSPTNMGWITHNVSFAAPGPIARLSFISLDNDAAGPAIDNIRVTAVPEPETYLLLAAGVAFIWLKGKVGARSSRCLALCEAT